MAETKPFAPAKLICGIIAAADNIFDIAKTSLCQLYGPIDLESSNFNFDYTDYYDKQIGGPLQRQFLSFRNLVLPEQLSSIKLQTNQLEEDIRLENGSETRIVNLDPGLLNGSSLVMATAKDFAHRIPLQQGIYAHLELLFGKDEVRTLDWTYPDFRTEQYHAFFLDVRNIYLRQMRETSD